MFLGLRRLSVIGMILLLLAACAAPATLTPTATLPVEKSIKFYEFYSPF